MPASPLPPGRQTETRLRSLLLVLLAALSTVAGSEAFRQLRPLEHEFPAEPKLGYYLAHMADYNVVFVGTSRLYRGMVPADFDARVAEHGHAVRSFNLGIGGMRAFEADRLVRFIVANAPPGLEYMFLGLGSYDPRIKSWEKGTRRATEWHTPRQTLAVARATWGLREPRSDRLRLIGQHLALFLRRQWSLGAGARTLDSWWRTLRAGADRQIMVRDAGFEGLEGLGNPVIRRRRRQFESRQDEFLRTVARNARQRRPIGRLTRVNLQGVVELGRVVRAAGPRPILLLDPNQGTWSGVGAEVAGGLPLINCDDPERYPELFDPRNRFDASHLNHAGARLYSRLLGDLFVDILESRDP